MGNLIILVKFRQQLHFCNNRCIAARLFSNAGKLYKPRTAGISVQAGMNLDQEYDLDFGLHSRSNLPTAPKDNKFPTGDCGFLRVAPPAAGL